MIIGLVEHLRSPRQVHMRETMVHHMTTCGSLLRIKFFLLISGLILGASLPEFIHASSELVLLHYGDERMQVDL